MTAKKKKRAKKITPEEQARRDRLRESAFRRIHGEGKHAGAPKDGCPLCAEAPAGTVQDKIDAPPPPVAAGMDLTGIPASSRESMMAPPTAGPTDAMGTPLLPGQVRSYEELALENQDVLASAHDPGAIEKERQHQAALAEARKADAEARVSYPQIGDENGDVVLHVLEDGFTALSKTWYHGEEITIAKGSQWDELSRDRTGRAFYEMGESEQIVRYGRVMFRLGPWPGVKVDPDNPDREYVAAMNSPNPQEALLRLQKKRQREAPVKVGV